VIYYQWLVANGQLSAANSRKDCLCRRENRAITRQNPEKAARSLNWHFARLTAFEHDEKLVLVFCYPRSLRVPAKQLEPLTFDP
jgi:hypothetical protein